jgi:hypothetical protein
LYNTLELLMMGIMVPETWWASNKICNKNSSVASSWHFISTYLYHIFLHYLIKAVIFGEELLKTKCVFWFSLQMFCEIFIILRTSQWYFIINMIKSLL